MKDARLCQLRRCVPRTVTSCRTRARGTETVAEPPRLTAAFRKRTRRRISEATRGPRKREARTFAIHSQWRSAHKAPLEIASPSAASSADANSESDDHLFAATHRACGFRGACAVCDGKHEPVQSVHLQLLFGCVLHGGAHTERGK